MYRLDGIKPFSYSYDDLHEEVKKRLPDNIKDCSILNVITVEHLKEFHDRWCNYDDKKYSVYTLPDMLDPDILTVHDYAASMTVGESKTAVALYEMSVAADIDAMADLLIAAYLKELCGSCIDEDTLILRMIAFDASKKISKYVNWNCNSYAVIPNTDRSQNGYCGWPKEREKKGSHPAKFRCCEWIAQDIVDVFTEFCNSARVVVEVLSDEQLQKHDREAYETVRKAFGNRYRT